MCPQASAPHFRLYQTFAISHFVSTFPKQDVPGACMMCLVHLLLPLPTAAMSPLAAWPTSVVLSGLGPYRPPCTPTCLRADLVAHAMSSQHFCYSIRICGWCACLSAHKGLCLIHSLISTVHPTQCLTHSSASINMC